MMRILFYLCIPLVVFSASSCKKADTLTQFNLSYDESVTIPSSTGINLPFNILTPDMETNSESEFAVHDTRKDLIEEIKLTSLGLDLTSPEGEDFSFLKSVSIYLNADGLDEVKVAWKDNIPNDAGTHLDLNVTSADLQDYIKKDKFSLRVNAVTDELLSKDHVIDVHATFFVDAKILGV